jgi:RNA polymerase sigma factor (sigma-70 family)
MSSGGSVTAWIRQLQAGEEAVLAQMHRRYWPRLVHLARQRLKGAPARAVDEEDVAQDAFWTFYRRLRGGGFRLANRHDLLALLTHIVACKAVNQIAHEAGVQKRGGGKVRGESDLGPLAGLHGVAGAGPTPLEQAILDDCYRHYVGRLPQRLRDFAELYLAGCTHREIAARLGCVERTVERKVPLILQQWQQMALEGLGEEVPAPVPGPAPP